MNTPTNGATSPSDEEVEKVVNALHDMQLLELAAHPFKDTTPQIARWHLETIAAETQKLREEVDTLDKRCQGWASSYTAIQEQNERLVKALKLARRFINGDSPTYRVYETIDQALSQSTGTPLMDRIKELEKWKEFPNKLRERLKHDSKGEVGTFGFVAMFMSMIDDIEKSLATHNNVATSASDEEVKCSVCNWTNGSLLKVNEPMQTPIYICHGCVKQQYETIAKLKAENDFLQNDNNAFDMWRKAVANREIKLEEERDSLAKRVNDLVSYVQHDVKCRSQRGSNYECTCGLSALLRKDEK